MEREQETGSIAGRVEQVDMIRLQIGQVMDEAGEKVGDNKLRKPALLVYEGTFMSMDGEVTLTAKDIQEIAGLHNSGLERLKRMFGGGAKIQVPVQLDHSTKSADTIGRVDGPVTLGTFKDEDGKEKAALYGHLMFIGKDNVEKAEDGRYTHLSVGLDKTKRLTEMSVTPFPAAPHASLLSKGQGETKMSYSEHMKKAAQYAKCKKHLTAHKGMSEADADKHLEAAKDEDLSRMEAEHDEHEKNMAAQNKDDQAEKDKKELAMYREKFASLKADQEEVRLAEAGLNISIRLSGLMSKGKITPAEFKTIDVKKLSAKSQDVVDEVMATYEKREPVINFKQAGTTKAIEPSKLAAEIKKQKRLALEKESRSNMPFTGTVMSNIDKERKRLADGGSMPGGPSNVSHMADEGGGMPGGPTNIEHMADKPAHSYEGLEADYETLHRMMEEGRHEEAKEHLKAMRAKHAEHMAKTVPEGEEAPQHMAAVKASLDELKGAHKKLRAKLELTTH